MPEHSFTTALPGKAIQDDFSRIMYRVQKERKPVQV